MSIYKEALAEAKQVREVAEQNAKKAILEEITPRVKKMIENQLLGEDTDEDDDEDIMYDSSDKKSDVVETVTQSESESEEVELTQESLEALARLASTNSELHGVKALRISQKLEELHSKPIDEVSYVEKLRQLKFESEKTYSALMEDKKKELISETASKVIEDKLEEINETIVNLYLPAKMVLESRRINKLNKRYNSFRVLDKGYKLTEGAQKVFGKKCADLLSEGLDIFRSLAELKQIVKNSKVDQEYKKVNDLVKEIYKMSKKTLNEEELKLIIKGLDPQDLEGSALSVDVEPADEEDAMDDGMGDDMGMDDDMGGMDDGMGGEEDLDLEMDMPMEMDADLDELGGMKFGTFSHRGKSWGSNARNARMAAAQSAAKPKPAPGPAPAEDPAAQDDMRRKKMGESEEGLDEEIEISEEMLTQELKKLKQRRAAKKLQEEKMKAMQAGNGPGEDLSDFGGGSKDDEMFVDGEDLNSMDPVGTGFTVKESEELSEDELQEFRSSSFGGGAPRSRYNAAKMQSIAKQREKEREAAKDKKDDDKSAQQNEGVTKTLKTYKVAILKLKEQNDKLKAQLREANLFNAKLVYANKLLQNENLKPKQRITVIESLEECESVKEVKQLYAKMSKALSEGKNDRLTESKVQVIGGSSKPTKPGSNLNEAETKEFTRWGELAGFLNE